MGVYYECPYCGEADPHRCECLTPRERQVASTEMWWDKYVPNPQAVEVIVGGDKEVRVRLVEHELRECRECGDEFLTKTLDTGTKWTRSCPSCLRMHT